MAERKSGKSDKRRGRRVGIKEAVVRYKTGSGLFAIFEGASERCSVLDISQRGLRFLTKDNLNVGNKLHFTLGIPILGGRPLKANGRIAWVQYSDRYGANVVGVQFLSMTRESMTRLKHLVSFLGTKMTIKQKVKMTFPEEVKKQPLLWELAREFEVSVNVTEGLLTDEASWFIAEVKGEREEVKEALKHLKKNGVKLEFLKTK